MMKKIKLKIDFPDGVKSVVITNKGVVLLNHDHAKPLELFPEIIKENNLYYYICRPKRLINAQIKVNKNTKIGAGGFLNHDTGEFKLLEISIIP